MPLALVSVHDKGGLPAFARRLAALGFRFLASGGTAEALRGAGLEAREVADYTGSPELLGGRVKTLHPAIHGGILARALDSDLAQLASRGWEPIDLVVVNLYPFEETVARPGVGLAEAIEEIDIGGVALMRAAAKNHGRVCLASEPADYGLIAAELESGGVTARTRRALAVKGFRRTAAYDAAIASYLAAPPLGEPLGGPSGKLEAAASEGGVAAREVRADAPADGGVCADAPAAGEVRADAPAAVEGPVLLVQADLERRLRYGENPHQAGAFYSSRPGRPPLGGKVLGGKELSYNNILDLDAAWRAVLDLEGAGAVIVKHLSPCGLAELSSAAELRPAAELNPAAELRPAAELNPAAEAFAAALASDPVSAFGGIAALNLPVDGAAALALSGLFLECVAAPGFSEEALAVLGAKKKLRLVEADPRVYETELRELRSAAGGILVQTPDRGDPPGAEWRQASSRPPSEEELLALRFAWRAVRHVRSNAIVLAKAFGGHFAAYSGDATYRGYATVGIGGGQTNRVDAVRQAIERAGERARGAVLASDAFFPFPDGVEAAAAAGVTALVQPGGSVRDAEVLAAAEKAGMAVLLTGTRHFRH